jgi:small-conductance mechanosensitive channel
MSVPKVQLLETLVLLTIHFSAIFVTKKIVNNSLKKAQLQRARRKIIIKATNIFTTIITFVILAGIWGLDQREIAVFASTILTVLGIAFFAQWSLLSNITSSILLFFNHPLKIGDTIKVMDKDCPFEGEVSDLSFFFVLIQTENGEIITIPNSLLFQKTISIIENEKLTKKIHIQPLNNFMNIVLK